LETYFEASEFTARYFRGMDERKMERRKKEDADVTDVGKRSL